MHTSDRERSRILGLRPLQAPDPLPREGIEPTNSARSLALSSQRIAGTLSVSCPVCAAQVSRYCWPAVGGFHGARYERGVASVWPGLVQDRIEGLQR